MLWTRDLTFRSEWWLRLKENPWVQNDSSWNGKSYVVGGELWAGAQSVQRPGIRKKAWTLGENKEGRVAGEAWLRETLQVMFWKGYPGTIKERPHKPIRCGFIEKLVTIKLQGGSFARGRAKTLLHECWQSK